jgi:hypothetical protein
MKRTLSATVSLALFGLALSWCWNRTYADHTGELRILNAKGTVESKLSNEQIKDRAAAEVAHRTEYLAAGATGGAAADPARPAGPLRGHGLLAGTR